MTWLAYALYPTRTGETSPIRSVDPIQASTDSALGLTVRFEDGCVDTVLVSHQPGQSISFGDLSTDAEAAVIRQRADNTVDRTFLTGGALLHRNGEDISEG